MKEKKYYSIAGIKARGWTDRMIDVLLGEPDKEVANPHYRCAAPMCLYLIERVEQTEETHEFKELLEKAEKRRKALAPSIERRKIEHLLKLEARKNEREKAIKNVIDKLEIFFPDVSIEELIDLAVSNWNKVQKNYIEQSYISKDSDIKIIKRACHNCLRHNYTNYDYIVDEARDVGAYYKIKQIICNKAVENYPFLMDDGYDFVYNIIIPKKEEKKIKSTN